MHLWRRQGQDIPWAVFANPSDIPSEHFHPVLADLPSLDESSQLQYLKNQGSWTCGKHFGWLSPFSLWSSSSIRNSHQQTWVSSIQIYLKERIKLVQKRNHFGNVSLAKENQWKGTSPFVGFLVCLFKRFPQPRAQEIRFLSAWASASGYPTRTRYDREAVTVMTRKSRQPR